MMRKEMEYVYAVYREGSFSKAALKLYISQPALSAVIKKLEKRIHSQLFSRGTNPVRLTPAGEYYVSSIEKIMAIQQEMDEHFEGMSKFREQQLTIGSPSYFCIYVLSELVRQFQELHPGVSVNFSEDTTLGLSKKLKDEEADFIFDVENLDERAFSNIVWGHERIVLAVPVLYEINDKLTDRRMTASEIRDGRHLDYGTPGVDLRLFSGQSFLLLKRSTDIYRRVMTICKKNGFTPEISMYLDQMLTCYHIACRGKGVAFIRDSVAKYVEQTDKLYFYKIDDELAIRAIKLYYKKTYHISSTAGAFLEFIKNSSTA
jgi:DNA-binding transcriptional LysR family regulator